METQYTDELARQLAREVRYLLAVHPHLRLVPKIDWLGALAEALLAETGEREDREAAEPLAVLVPGQLAVYHAGASPATGRPSRRGPDRKPRGGARPLWVREEE